MKQTLKTPMPMRSVDDKKQKLLLVLLFALLVFSHVFQIIENHSDTMVREHPDSPFIADEANCEYLSDGSLLVSGTVSSSKYVTNVNIRVSIFTDFRRQDIAWTKTQHIGTINPYQTVEYAVIVDDPSAVALASMGLMQSVIYSDSFGFAY